MTDSEVPVLHKILDGNDKLISEVDENEVELKPGWYRISIGPLGWDLKINGSQILLRPGKYSLHITEQKMTLTRKG